MPPPKTPVRIRSQMIDHGSAKAGSILVQAGSPVVSTPSRASSSVGAASTPGAKSVVRIFGSDAEERGSFAVKPLTPGVSTRASAAASSSSSSSSVLGDISQVMSLNTDGGILVRTLNRADRFLCMDAETGQTTDDVAVTWESGAGTGTGGATALTLADLTPQRRHGQYRSSSSTMQFFGLGGDGTDTLFSAVYDPRESSRVVRVDGDDSHRFKSIQFTCTATTCQGYMVTGDTKGNVRLYNNISAAKAVISDVACGEPVLGVDTTDFGEYVLWTTRSGVYVVRYPDGEESWGKRGEVRPRPVMLVIRPQQEDEIIQEEPDASFVPAKFDLEEIDGHINNQIVAYFGSYFVQWNMRQVTVATKKLADKINEAEDPNTVELVEVLSSRVLRADASVDDHTMLRGENYDVASLLHGVQNIELV